MPGTTKHGSCVPLTGNGSGRDVNLSAMGTGHSMYSLQQHRSFYEENKVFVKNSQSFKQSIKTVKKVINQQGSPLKHQANKRFNMNRYKNQRQSDQPLPPATNKLNQTAEAVLQQPPLQSNHIKAAISTISQLQQAIEVDSNRRMLSLPKTKKWEYLKYKGRKFTPQNLLKVTKRTENKHGRNVNHWTQMRKKNNNIDWDAKKSFENLKRRIDTSDHTVARIKYGGISLFDSNQSQGLESAIHGVSQEMASVQTGVNPLIQSQMSTGSVMKKVNVPILDNDDYKKCLTQFARSSTPANQMNSTMKKWYQPEKTHQIPDNSTVKIVEVHDIDEQNSPSPEPKSPSKHRTLSPRELQAKLDFPNNPAFFPDKGDFLRSKLKSALQFCRDKKIAMNLKQQIQMNVRRSQNTYSKFSNAVDDMYKGKSIDEGEYFLQMLQKPVVSDIGQDVQGIVLLAEKSNNRRNAFNANFLLQNERYKDQKTEIREKEKVLKEHTQKHLKEQYKRDEKERETQFIRLSDYLNNPARFKLEDDRKQSQFKRLMSRDSGSRNKPLQTQNFARTMPSAVSHKRAKSSGMITSKLYSQKQDGTFQITQMTAVGQTNKVAMSRKLNEILKRVELDRPILFQEKLDVIWNAQAEKQGKEKEDENQVDACRNIRMALDKKKKFRQKINSDQRLVYRKLLNFLKQRKSHPLQDEIELLNVIKIVIDGGWIITQEEFDKLMNVLQIPNELQQNHPQFMEFLDLCLRELKQVNLIHSYA